MDRVAGIEADDLFDLGADALGIGSRQIDLVEHRDDLQIIAECQVDVGQGLRFHALAGIHHQQRTFTGLQAAAHLIGEVNVAGGIDQVERVELTISGLELHARGLQLDGDAPLPLEVHVVQELRLHVPVRHRAGVLQQAIGQGRFPVVDVGNDAEIAEP